MPEGSTTDGNLPRSPCAHRVVGERPGHRRVHHSHLDADRNPGTGLADVLNIRQWAAGHHGPPTGCRPWWCASCRARAEQGEEVVNDPSLIEYDGVREPQGPSTFSVSGNEIVVSVDFLDKSFLATYRNGHRVRTLKTPRDGCLDLRVEAAGTGSSASGSATASRKAMPFPPVHPGIRHRVRPGRGRRPAHQGEAHPPCPRTPTTPTTTTTSNGMAASSAHRRRPVRYPHRRSSDHTGRHRRCAREPRPTATRPRRSPSRIPASPRRSTPATKGAIAEVLSRYGGYVFYRIYEESNSNWGYIYRFTSGTLAHTYTLPWDYAANPNRSFVITDDAQVYQLLISTKTARILQVLNWAQRVPGDNASNT